MSEDNDIPEKAELSEEIPFTGEEIKFIDSVLSEAENSSLIPLSTGAARYTPLREIRKKLSDANSEINQRHREIRNDRNCDEDGHVWGNPTYNDESDYGEIISRGCRYCPAAQYRRIGQDSEWKTVEEWNDLGIPVYIGGPQE